MRLAVQAELSRLARLLRCDSASLSFLRRFDAVELRALRVSVYARMYADHQATYARIASASRLLPMKVTAPLAQRMLPARVSAGVVASLPADQAAAMAGRMSVEYVADVSSHLSPALAEPVLSRLSPAVVVRVAGLLRDRADYDTMAEVVGALTDEQVTAVVASLDDAGTLVQVALRVTDEAALQRLTAVIPEERLQQMVVWGSRRTRLWPELTGLLTRLAPEQRQRLLSAVRT